MESDTNFSCLGAKMTKTMTTINAITWVSARMIMGTVETALTDVETFMIQHQGKDGLFEVEMSQFNLRWPIESTILLAL